MTATLCNHGDFHRVKDHRDHDFFRFLVDLTDAVIAARDTACLAEKTADCLHEFFGLDYIGLKTYEPASSLLNAYSFTFEKGNRCPYNIFSKPLHATLAGMALRRHEKVLFNRDTLSSHAGKYPYIAKLAEKGLQVLLYLPLVSAGNLLGILALGSFSPFHFTADTMELLNRVSARLAVALDVMLTHRETSISLSALPEKNTIKDTEIRETGLSHNVIGHSSTIQSILQQIRIVASSNATVLLQGETGTGKGLIAQTIHDLSDRKGREMVKMNCTAIPTELMESELFGHEKGAFTGALNRRIGHFEQADKSTLFLDEIGDMPLDLQPKLLSVLQEHQIRRLGSTQSISVDVRCIAATNCDLVAKIADKTFRSDLFYRLNVFPITVPPLRERAEDIPLLAQFFIRKYAREMNRHITGIPSETLALMTRLPWPGNIRELENVMERAVILTGQGKNLLNLSPEALLSYTTQNSPLIIQSAARSCTPASAIPQTDRDTIVEALRETGGRIGGKTGAAERLGLKRTTLLARIKRFGIDVDDFREKDH